MVHTDDDPHSSKPHGSIFSATVNLSESSPNQNLGGLVNNDGAILHLFRPTAAYLDPG